MRIQPERPQDKQSSFADPVRNADREENVATAAMTKASLRTQVELGSCGLQARRQPFAASRHAAAEETGEAEETGLTDETGEIGETEELGTSHKQNKR